MHYEQESPEDKLYAELQDLAKRVLYATNVKYVELPLLANVDWQKGPNLTAGKTYPIHASLEIRSMMGRDYVDVVMILTDDIGAESQLSGAHLMMFAPIDREAVIAEANATLKDRRIARLTKALESLSNAAASHPISFKVGDVVSRPEKLAMEVVDDEYTWAIAHVMSREEQLLWWKAQGGNAPLQHVILVGTATDPQTGHAIRTCTPASAVDLVKIGTLADFGLTVPEGNWLEMILPMGPAFEDLLK